MTDEDKKRISDYMGWNPYPPECMGETVFFRDEIHGDIRWDMNAAALCVQEMQKRDDWVDFYLYFICLKVDPMERRIPEMLIAKNFFGAMAAWLEVKK